MKLQKIINRLQKLHPKEIDLSLDRIFNLCKKLNNPQNNIKAILFANKVQQAYAQTQKAHTDKILNKKK